MKQLLSNLLGGLVRRRPEQLSPELEALVKIDHDGIGEVDPGVDRSIHEAVLWLCRAQDHSPSADGGVARAYSLKNGWQSSYPETTGYIVPTFIDCAPEHQGQNLLERARRMLDWLEKIQMPSGAFQGGRIDSHPVMPVVFNTGQILLGLVAGVHAFGNYRPAMRAAADWLVSVQDKDGCWRRHSSPFASAGEKTYETHTAWGLLEAARVEPNRGYGEAALANVRWALTRQRTNGWMDNCCLSDFSRPLTHTLGYALRGICEAYRYSRDRQFLDSSMRLADGLRGAIDEDGFLPGCLGPNWERAADWACLTGSAQVAHCWLYLYSETGDVRYRDAAVRATRYVRRTLRFDGSEDLRGGVKGSFPLDGRYCQYEYPNWAAKFFIDALRLERAICRSDVGVTEVS